MLLMGSFKLFSKPKSENPTIKDMPEGTYKLDLAHASLAWQVSHLGLSNYKGRFTDFNAEIMLNPKQVTQSEITATVNPNSLQTNYPYPEKKDFNQILISDKKWFDADNHPQISFTSSSIKKVAAPSTYRIKGHLTFLGATKPVLLLADINRVMLKQPFTKRPTIGISAQGIIKRAKWGMDAYVPEVGNEVTINIEAEFSLKQSKSSNNKAK